MPGTDTSPPTRGGMRLALIALALPACVLSKERASPSSALYDYTRSTSENYASPNARLRREFFASRVRFCICIVIICIAANFMIFVIDARAQAGLDYRYHTRYTMERQATQDDIIRSMLSYQDAQRNPPRSSLFQRVHGRGRRLMQPRQPWAIVTAGCMGAGKRHVIYALDRAGLLPLTSFVRVDMDRIRARLPEMDGYVDRDRSTAGMMTQREAGLIAEVATEEALARGLNVWVDSTLTDSWWTQELQRIKRMYPHRLCCLHVTASWQSVTERAAKRGKQTGRAIPLPVLRCMHRAVPDAVSKVSPLFDEYVEVDNDARQPILKTTRDVRALLHVCRAIGGDRESLQLEAWLPGF